MTPAWFVRDILPGVEGVDVCVVQRRLGVPVTGVYDALTRSVVQGLQRKFGIEEDGIVGRKTAKKIGDKSSVGTIPGWFVRDITVGMVGPDVQAVKQMLGLANLPVEFDRDAADAVRRFQSAVGVAPSGVVGEETAVALADRSV